MTVFLIVVFIARVMRCHWFLYVYLIYRELAELASSRFFYLDFLGLSSLYVADPWTQVWTVPSAYMQTFFYINTVQYYKCISSCDFLFFKDFIYLFDRGREITSKQRSRQRGRGKQALHWAESPRRGSIPGPWDHDLSRRQRLNPVNHQAPLHGKFVRNKQLQLPISEYFIYFS